MVAAWISAETGVGPSIASGSHTWSGICALLPQAPTNNSNATAVITPNWPSASWGFDPILEAMSTKSSVPKAWNATIMPRIRPASPIRLTRKAFFPASAADCFLYQKPISR